MEIVGDSVEQASQPRERRSLAHGGPARRRDPRVAVRCDCRDQRGSASGEAGIGALGPAILRCQELCDAAEGEQIFLSQTMASLLEDENLGDLMIRDVGKRKMRRTRGAVRAYELVFPAPGASATS